VTFSWVGTPPTGDSGQQLIIPLTIDWSSGYFQQLNVAEQCQD
jgi:hypothetical protein